MNFLNEKIKHILIDIVIVFVIPIGIFYFYTTLGVPEALFGTSQPGAELDAEGAKFLAKLNELDDLKIDTDVFNSVEYKSLVDSTVAPPTEEQGRPHPFIPPTRVTPPAPSAASSKKTQSTAAFKNLNTLVSGQ